MKFSSLFSFLLASSFVLTGCQESAEDIIESITPNVKATIGTADFETNIAVGVNTVVAYAITATKDEEVIVLTLPNIDEGNYPIDILATNATYTPMVSDSLNSLYTAFKGNIEITSVNTLKTQVQGNFEFTCVNPNTLDTLVISNGQLNNIPIK